MYKHEHEANCARPTLECCHTNCIGIVSSEPETFAKLIITLLQVHTVELQC
jgi:hypothetical protein